VRRCSRRWSRDSPAAHGEDHGEASWALQLLMDNIRADTHTSAGKCALKEVAAHEVQHQSGFSSRNCGAWWTHAEAVHS